MPILRPNKSAPKYPNLLPEVRVYGTNKDEITDDQLNMLSGKGNSPNVFSTQANESIWNSWAENGKPLVRPFVGDMAKTGRAYYQEPEKYKFRGIGPWTGNPKKIAFSLLAEMQKRKAQNSIQPSMTIRPGNLSDYFAELSHAQQTNEGTGKNDWEKYKTREAYDRYAYTDPKAGEYQAHRILEPKLLQKYPIPDANLVEAHRALTENSDRAAAQQKEQDFYENQYTLYKTGVPLLTMPQKVTSRVPAKPRMWPAQLTDKKKSEKAREALESAGVTTSKYNGPWRPNSMY